MSSKEILQSTQTQSLRPTQVPLHLSIHTSRRRHLVNYQEEGAKANKSNQIIRDERVKRWLITIENRVTGYPLHVCFLSHAANLQNKGWKLEAKTWHQSTIASITTFIGWERDVKS